MPELPEVETIARDLHRALKGKKIIGIKAFDAKYTKYLSSLKKAALGKTINSITRRAKIIIVRIGDNFLVIHLKMTGQLIYRSKKTIIAGGHPIVSTGVTVPNTYTRFIFSFNDGELYFNDLRKFGWVRPLKSHDIEALKRSLGIEPLSKEFSFKKFQELFTKRRGTIIKAFLLDQKIIAGLGNIYVDEALFRSGLKPTRRVNSLTTVELRRLWKAIPYILTKSISQRGTTFSNFLDPKGLRGNFVPYLKVYGKKGQPCVRCGRPIVKKKIAGRGTHWCDYCQK